LQEKEKAKRMNATCGPKCLEQLEKFSLVGSWAKMFSALLIGQGEWYSTKCKLTWKLRGTKYGRMYFQLVVRTPRIEGTGFGLLPTPTAGEIHDIGTNIQSLANCNKGGRVMREFASIITAENKFLPTPNASDNRDRGGPKDKSIKRRLEMGKQVGLTMMVDGQLNPRFVAEMMGYPPNWLELPFQNTEKNQLKDLGTQ
jgi:hypothetical protein